MSRSYDALVIGTGQAGPSLAAHLARQGRTVAIVERQKVGGTCVNYGCIPTKALVASARAAYVARRGADFGVRVGGPITVDVKAVKARMREIAGHSNRGLTRMLESTEGVTLYRGHARFTGRRTVRLDGGETLRAEMIFINVGGRARVPDLPGVREVPFLTSSGLLELEQLPEHLIVVGGSYIGLEFAQMYRRFGSRVTVVERGTRLIARDDEDVSETIREVLEREGVEMRLEAECIALARHGDGVAITVDCAGGPPEITGSHLLLAVGRVPNTDDLGLEHAGVEVDERGYVVVDDELRTSAGGIWALGDCNGRGAFTHTAYNDYEIVAANLAGGRRRVSDRILCYGLFVDPPLGRVGITEAQARASGKKVLIGLRPMKHVGRARERSEMDGFIKILVDEESEQILGAAILGINGDEVVQTLSALMYAGASYHVLAHRAVGIHPTVAELLPTVMQSLKPLKRE
ncbi:MAG: FAD-containing oxidoreductase [Acidobacteria bacterium]|nr:MAG: FAD-containing oxidoreductase [Acidobacteriota bacterium]